MIWGRLLEEVEVEVDCGGGRVERHTWSAMALAGKSLSHTR